jgi:hypothetical protein
VVSDLSTLLSKLLHIIIIAYLTVLVLYCNYFTLYYWLFIVYYSGSHIAREHGCWCGVKTLSGLCDGESCVV